MITDLPDELMYVIFTKINTKTMISCRQVCKKWHQLINDEKRLMNRFQISIISRSFPKFTHSQPEIVPKFTSLKLVRWKFTTPLSEYLLALLPTIQDIQFIDCRVDQQDMMSLFETIFGAINSLVDSFKLDGFTLLPSACEVSRVKRMKSHHTETTSSPTVKNLSIKISDIKQIIEFFEHLKDMNVKVQRLSIDLHDSDDLCTSFHYEMLNQLLNLFHNHYQHLIKELTIDLRKTHMDLDRFYGRISAMADLRLEVLRFKEIDASWLCGDFKVFIENQTSLKKLEFQEELDPNAVNSLREIFPKLDSLVMGVAKPENQNHFWRNFPITSNLKTLKIDVAHRRPLSFGIDFEKVPAVETLEISLPTADICTQLEPTLHFLNLKQLVILKKLSICDVALDGQNVKLIFEYMLNLEELELKTSLDTNVHEIYRVSKNGTSINNLKRLHTLWLDEAAVTHRFLVKLLQLPCLRKLGFFKKPAKIYLSYYNYLDDVQNSCLKIPFKILKTLARDCPRLFEICDDEFGVTYQRSEKSHKFVRTQGYQDDADSGSSVDDTEDFDCDRVGQFNGRLNS